MKRRDWLRSAAMLLAGDIALLGLPRALSAREEFPDGPDDDYSPMPPSAPRLKPHASLVGGRHRVHALALSADGARIAVSEQQSRVFKVWDAVNGREQVTSGTYPGEIHALAFDPIGKSIASTVSNGYIMLGVGDKGDPPSIRISDVATAQKTRDLLGLEGYAKGLALTRSGLAVALDTHEVLRAWKISDGADVYSLNGPVNRIHGGGFEAVQSGFGVSDDGRRAASLSTDARRSTDAAVEGEIHPEHTVNLWDAKLGTCRVLNAKAGPLRAVALSPDGSRVVVATTDQQIMAFDFVTEKRVFAFYAGYQMVGGIGPYYLAFSPDGDRFVIGKKDGVLRMYDSDEGRHLDTIRGPRTFIRAVAFLPDRLRVVSGGYNEAGSEKLKNGAVIMNYDPLWVWDAMYRGSPGRYESSFRRPHN